MIDVTQETFYWFLIADLVAVYLGYWAVDWIWFRYVDWHVARRGAPATVRGTRRRQPGQPGAPY